LTLVVARAIGVMSLKDRQEADHKIIAVSVNDPEFDHFGTTGGDVASRSHHRRLDRQSSVGLSRGGNR
jgi:hypothetical protein